MINEQALLKAIADGDVTAFSTLFYAHHQQMGHYAYQITRSQEIAEELVQDVFVKIWLNREKLQDVKNIKAYLFTVVKNETLNAIRTMANKRKHQQEFEHELSQGNPEMIKETEYENELKLVVESAISCLPPQQQKVFLLRQQGFKNAQIAAKMQISPHSAKKYQQLALQSIEKFLRTKALMFSLFLYFFQK